LHNANVKVKVIGDILPFPKIIKQYIENLEILTQGNNGVQINLALNYGGRAEIIRATKKISGMVREGELEINEINEKIFSKYLYTGEGSYPDLIIRTAGEKRLSNFLLWQSAYSELYFSEKNWPDFEKSDLKNAIDFFNTRSRKYGGLDIENASLRKN
jgi:undecaprenyl diphosphate synthase